MCRNSTSWRTKWEGIVCSAQTVWLCWRKPALQHVWKKPAVFRALNFPRVAFTVKKRKKYPCPHLSSIYALKVPRSSLKQFLHPSSKHELTDCQSSILTGWGTGLACLSIKQWHCISYFSQWVAWKAKGLFIFAGWFSLWSLCRACKQKWQFTQATKKKILIYHLQCHSLKLLSFSMFLKLNYYRYGVRVLVSLRI